VETNVTKRVLIVDDDLIVIAVLREFFTYFRHGHAYEITSARSVAEGSDILLRERFDLILLDMAMPQTGDRWPWEQGLDLLKQVRDLGLKAPVLMMTGGWDTRKEAEALNEGALGHLHKPFALRELDHLVALALGSGPRATGG
jgi:DNA-binding NtrC family response regulator